MRKRIILLLLILQVPVRALWAQYDLHFSHLGMNNGLTNSSANVILQDRKGFIWIGTWNGLNRFDGYECKIYQPDFHDSTAISNREIVELMEDKAGNIWIGTSNGLNCLNPETGKVKTYEFRNRILSLCEDSKGNIWIGTWNGGLYKLIVESEEIKHYIANDIISDLCLDSRNILWVGSYYGLVKFNLETEKYERYVHVDRKNSITNNTVTQLSEDSQGHIWIGTWGGGVDRLEVNNKGSQLFFTNFNSSNGTNAIAGNVISKLYYDRFNNLWIGTRNNGLCKLPKDQQALSPKNARFTSYTDDPKKSSSIKGQRISAIMVDNTGILWVGASDVAYTSIIENGVSAYRIPKQIDESRPASVSAVTSYGKQLWVSTEFNISQYELDNDGYYSLKKAYARPRFVSNGWSYDCAPILKMFATSEGLWVGTDDTGLLFFPYRKDRTLNMDYIKVYNQNSSPGIPGNKISCILHSKKKDKTLWIGTMQTGLACLTFGKDSVKSTYYYAGKDKWHPSDNNIRCLYEDNKGRLWLGTQNGLNCYDVEGNVFEKFFYSASDVTSINDNVINTISEDSKGNIWIGTNSGLNKMIEKINKEGVTRIGFKGYPQTPVLKNEIVTNILEDPSKNLWIRTYKGFLKFNINNESIVGEYFSEDFANTRLDRNTTISAQENEFVISSTSDFIVFNPDSLFKKSIPSKVCITDFRVFNNSVEQNVIHNDIITGCSLPYAKDVNLSYKDEMITIVFSAMDYKNIQKNEYQYKLEGFDKQWNNGYSKNSATYTNIPPGDYVFNVKARNSEGFWSKDVTQLNIHITPPLWKTKGAYFFYLLIVIGIVYFFKKYTIIKENEKHRLKFEKLKNDELTRLNELKSFFFTDITHELKTPLTLILGPASELASDQSLRSSAAKNAQLIKNSAFKLLRLVNQLMEFRKVEKGINNDMQIETYDIRKLLEEVHQFFIPMADSRKIQLGIKSSGQELLANIDVDKMEKVIFNLVSNAFKYSMDGGIINVTAGFESEKLQNDTLVIVVEDKGIGISKEHQLRVFDRFYQVNQIRTQSTGGIGLFLAKSLVEQHNGTIFLESELGKGSCFTIKIPTNLPQTKNNYEENSTELIDEVIVTDELNQTSNDDEFVLNNKKATILITEDDTDLKDFLVNGLNHIYNIISCSNGVEAFEKAKMHVPDLILTDIMMPEMDGYELCQKLQKEVATSHIPVIFITAKTMADDELDGLKFGVIDYVCKPFNLVAVRLKINNILKHQQKIQDRFKIDHLLEPANIELTSLDDVFLKEAVEAVNDHIDDPDFDVEAFSDVLKVSSNQAYRKIKALTGQTAKEFIRNQRLKTAASLLIQNKRSISEVIYMVGFTSPSYFTRCFKNYYGCAPKEYIERHS
nr:two-component regulator propeller domain-containing protein [uncultured Carboxylicivirga sp.]